MWRARGWRAGSGPALVLTAPEDIVGTASHLRSSEQSSARSGMSLGEREETLLLRIHQGLARQHPSIHREVSRYFGSVKIPTTVFRTGTGRPFTRVGLN